MSSRLRFARYEATGRGSIVTSRPDSSRASRSAACSGCSPGSTLPDRVSHAPAPASFRDERRMASTRGPRNTATATATTNRAASLIRGKGRGTGPPCGRRPPPEFCGKERPGASALGCRLRRRGPALVDDLAHLADHDGHVERLLQEVDAAVEHAVLPDGV